MSINSCTCGIPLAENVGAAEERLAVFKRAGPDTAIKIVQRDFRHQGPAKAPLDHFQTGGDVVHHKAARIPGHAILIPPAGHLSPQRSVGLMVDIQIIRERLSLILPGIDQADILLREEELRAVPRVLAPQHRNVQRTVQHLLVKVSAVPGGNIQPDTGILFVVFGQHLRQAVVGKIDRHARF